MSCRERLLRLVREAQRVGQSHTHSSAPPEEEELRALLRRREELRARLRSARRQRQRRRLFSQAFPPLPGEREAQETAQGRGALRAYLKRVRRGRMGRDAVVAHRLSGRSVFRHSEGVTGVRYDTFHNGVFYESYYLFLRGEGDQEELHRHTIPAFVRTAQLWREKETHGLKWFLERIDSLLQGFVGRREQLRELLEAGSEQQQQQLQHLPIPQSHSVLHTASLDLIEFPVRLEAAQQPLRQLRARSLEVQLVFDDLSSMVPSRCAVRLGEGESQHRLRQLERIFLCADQGEVPSRSLLDSFRMCFGGGAELPLCSTTDTALALARSQELPEWMVED